MKFRYLIKNKKKTYDIVQNSEKRKKQKEKKRTEEIATPEMFYRKED